MIDFLESWIDDVCGPDKNLVDVARQRAEISMAGEALRRLGSQPRAQVPRKFTGRIGHGRRGVVGQTVVLADHSLGRLLVARRGWICVAHVDPFSVRRNRISYFPAAEVAPFKDPSAVALGRAKRGIRERPSPQKARAARVNGSAPPRPGSRPRGRPRSKASKLLPDQAKHTLAAP
jgi:hypothetical protein